MEDRIFDAQVRPHDLEGGNPAATDFGQEALADDPAHRIGQTEADLVLLVGRKHAQDAVDGLPRIDGVKGAQDEMARFGGGKGNLHRFPVAHLADEDDLRRLAQSRPQAV